MVTDWKKVTWHIAKQHDGLGGVIHGVTYHSLLEAIFHCQAASHTLGCTKPRLREGPYIEVEYSGDLKRWEFISFPAAFQ